MRTSNKHRRARMRYLLIAVGCAVVAGSAGVAATSAAPARTSGADASVRTIRVGDAVDLTGGFAIYGPAYAKAAGIAVMVANRALRQAGVKDIKVAIEHADSGSSPTNAVSAARKLVTNGASCLVGPVSSPEVQAMTLAVAMPAGIPVISPSTSSPNLTTLKDDGLLSRIAPSAAVEAPVFAQALSVELGRGKTLAVVSRNDTYGQGYSDQFKTAWKRLGGSVQGPYLVDANASSYNSEADKIVDGKPDAIVQASMFPPDWGKLGAALVRTGKFTTKELFLGGGQPAIIPDYIPEAAMDGAHGLRPSLPIGTKTSQGFDALYKAAKGPADRQIQDANNFDATTVCILAAIAAKSSDPRKIADKVQAVTGPPGKKYTYLQLADAIKDLRAGKDIDYEGVSGGIDLDSNGDSRAASFDWYQYQNRKLTVVRQYVWAHGKIRVKKIP